MKIGDWPFGPPGVACRTCLRAPCRCPPVLLRYFPMAFPDPTGEDVEIVFQVLSHNPPRPARRKAAKRRPHKG